MIVDLKQYKNKKYPEYTTEEEVWRDLVALPENQMMIVTKSDGKLRVAKVNAARFAIDPESL